MKRVYSVTLTHGGRKFAAYVTVQPGGTVEASNPLALKITEQLLAGHTHGRATSRIGAVSFKLTNAEFTTCNLK